MKRGIFFICSAVLFLWPVSASSGEDTVQQRVVMEVAEISVLAITNNLAKLTVVPSLSEEQGFQDAVDFNTNIQYSSTVGLNQSRELTARWAEGDSAPAGCVLKLRAATSGKVNEGYSTAEIILSSTDQTIISGIRSCATGIGPADGARLVYVLSVVDSTRLTPGEIQSATLIFTLKDTA